MSRSAFLAAALMASTLAQAAIDYPVDVANTRWALLNDASGEIVPKRDNIKWPRLDGKRVRVEGHTWLLRITEPPPPVDPRVFELVEKRDIRRAANQYVISYTAKWRSKADMEAMLDAAVTQHSLTCAQGVDIQSACAAAAGIAQQLADGDLTATNSEKRRARKCAAWVKACVQPNEDNGERLLGELRTAYQTRNDAVPAPIPDLNAGWTDAPATP